MITALLVLSDLFVKPNQTTEGPERRQRAACLGATSFRRTTDHALPSCPACGLPVFAHRDDAPARFSGLSWRQGAGSHVTLFPFVTGQVHANDDDAADGTGWEPATVSEGGLWNRPASGSSVAFPIRGEASQAGLRGRAAATGAPSVPVPEMAKQSRSSSIVVARAAYAGSRLKTSLDILGAGALLIALAPLMLAIGFLLAASGGRPVLVHQDRPDWSGRCFRVSRFRSASPCSPGAGGPVVIKAASRSSPSMTMRFEVFLHRSGLACLPLLVSVLRGDLSFVGPDPVMPRMSRRDRVGAAILAEVASRQGARPGLTGWAEVNTGTARGRAITARQKIACDLYYLENGSPLLDLRILVRALDAMASRDRA